MKRTVKYVSLISILFCLTVTSRVIAIAQQTPSVNDGGEVTAAVAFSRYEKALQATTDPDEKFYLVMKATSAAFAAGDNKKANAYALDLLQQASTRRHDWNSGNVIHLGNTVLGLIALAAGDITEAKRLLLEAGKTKGSPQLDSFGPNMRLVKELLARGEKEVVIQYFELCDKFWECGHDDLREWKAIVINGEIPEFGANLIYRLEEWRYENWYKYGY